MKFEDVNDENIKEFNKFAVHPLQSFEWGEFRKKNRIKVIRKIGHEKGKPVCSFQITIHKIPKLPWNIGYLPKGTMPTKEIVRELKNIGEKENCIFIQLEPNVENIKNNKLETETLGLKPSFHPLFTKYTFWIDLTKSEEELLSGMHPKTRYNIKVAQKHGVEIVEDNSPKAFAQYLRLTKETTQRQRFYAHNENYHKLMWETLRPAQGKHSTNELTAHLLLANYQPPTMNHKPVTLVAWILFVFKDRLYYPYGASSNEHRETMASNLIMWKVIQFGKKLGLKELDMWGALGQNPDKNDPWYGFHRFKEGYGGNLVEFIGSYDLVINPFLYQLYKIADKVRWSLLRLLK